MRTLLFTLEYPPFMGGVSNYYENMVSHWPESESFFVLTNGRNKSNNPRVVYTNLVSRFMYPKWFISVLKLLYYIVKHRIDHVLVGHLLPLGTATYLVTRFTGTEYSVVIHGMDFAFAIRNKRKKFLTRLILKNSQNIICGNSYVAEMVKEFLGATLMDKIKIVNPGINNVFVKNDELTKEIISKFDLENKIILLSIGRLVKRKGFDKVVELMSEINQVVPNMKYVLVGKGPDEAYIKNCQKKGSDILYIDSLTEEEKWAWLSLCDIFIMPSRNINGDFEGFGIVYLEANLAHKPVIGGASGGVVDAIQEMHSGILVDPEDSQKIKEAIMTLATDKNLRQKLGAQGQSRAILEFNWPKQINKIYQIIK